MSSTSAFPQESERTTRPLSLGLSAPLPLVGRGEGWGEQPLRRAEKKRSRSTVPHDTFFRKPSSLLPLAGSQPPTPYPSPPGGGGLKRCATNPFVQDSEETTRSLRQSPSAPLPLVERGEGKAFPSGTVSIEFRRLLPLMPLRKKFHLSIPCRLTAPHPSPLPTRGRGAEGWGGEQPLRQAVRLQPPSSPHSTTVHLPPLISSMRKAERSRPRWSSGDMV